MTRSPSPNGSNGRAASGRFARGNAGGPGNPHGPRVAKLRGALLQAVSEADVQAIVRRMIEQAKAGDVAAAKEVLTRCLGKPEAVDLLERIEAFEAMQGPEGSR